MKKLLLWLMIVTVVVSMVAAFSLAGCKTTTTETTAAVTTAAETTAAETTAAETTAAGVAVGIVLPTKDEPRWIQDETRFNDALKTAGYTAEILFSEGSSAKEKENVEALITKGIKVLIICPQDATAAAASAEEARAAGIKVSFL